MAKTLSKKELEKLTDLYDNLHPYIKEAAKSNSTLTAIKREVMVFADKNSNILQTNMIGRQLLFNKTTEDSILSAIGVDKEMIRGIIKESDYFDQFGNFQLIDQLIFAIPLLMLAGEYYKLKKYDESEFIFTIAWYKPYATVVFKYFGKFETNEDQMLYTIENLSERYDIKRYGTLQNTIVKKAKSSYDNYIESLARPITDALLHRDVFSAGVYSRLNSFVQELFREYQKNKGKYLPFEESTFEGTEDSEGEIFDRDIASDAAVKDSLVKKAVVTMNRNPIDIQLVDVAAKYGFMEAGPKSAFSESYSDILKSTLSEISARRSKDYPVIFESIIGAFLFEVSPYTGKKFTTKELRSPVFVATSIKNFMKSPNTKNRNLLNLRSLMEDILEECSSSYINSGDTKRSKIRRAVYMYFLLLVQKG
jgi:hypothetical protein